MRSGLRALQAGRLDEARSLQVAAGRQKPDAPGPSNLGGLIALAGGEFADAAKLFKKAAGAAPERADIHLNLARAFEAARRHREALAAYETALSLVPDDANTNLKVARLHLDAGDQKSALAYSRIGLALAPRSVDALFAHACALRAAGRLEEAEIAFRDALEEAPDDLRVLTGYASLLAKRQVTGRAVELYRRAADLDGDNLDLLAALAATSELHGDIEESLAIYERVLAMAPGNPDYLFRRAGCLRDLGQFDAATEGFEAALKLDPSHGASLMALARMKRLQDTPTVRNRLASAIADASRRPEHRAQAGFAMGELLDRSGESDAAFERFAQANRLLRDDRIRRGERFDPEELQSSRVLLERHLAAEFARDTSAWGVESDLPVFVVGLPRSGTTLVEQICASHSRVHGAGELEVMLPVTREISFRNRGVEGLANWDADHARGLAEAHIAELEQMAGGAARVVNKTPLNLLRLGSIGALFPRSKVIWCRRDPRDVVVSQHTMFFGEGNLFSTDIVDCAFAARQIEGIGEAWRRESRLPILEIVYEDLVADLETNVRRIIDFLDLDWEPACLDFQNTRRHVDTPSSWQVRQPIYTSSVGRWRRFEKHLGPMLKTLAQPLDAPHPGTNP